MRAVGTRAGNDVGHAIAVDIAGSDTHAAGESRIREKTVIDRARLRHEALDMRTAVADASKNRGGARTHHQQK